MDTPTIAGYIAAVAVLAFLGYIVYGFVDLMWSLSHEWRDEYALRMQNAVRGKEKVVFEPYLQNFDFYQKLPDHLKMKFVLRVKNFIKGKNFETREGLQLTAQMQILVAASAVQLTFGLSKYLLERFSKIILYPDSYYSSIGKAYHMGETNPKGIIVLSWKDLVNGYNIRDDAFNVGLHEMAHALELELLLQEDYDIFFGTYFVKWSRIAHEEFENVANDRQSFLRQYAGVNQREFFAVCIEYFFEASEEFKSHLPQLYYHLCVLLNQDPMRSDTRVPHLTRESFEQLRETITSYAPIFNTRPSWTHLSVGFWILPAVFLFMGLTVRRWDIAVFPMILMFFIYGIASIFKLNRIILYDQFIAVRNVWGKFTGIYYLDDIVTISFGGTDDEQRIEVILAGEGKVYKHSHLYNSKTEDINTLQRQLKEKGILVR